MLIFQQKNLNLSDFFLEWFNLRQVTLDIIETSKNPFEKALAQILDKSLHTREEKITSYPGKFKLYFIFNVICSHPSKKYKKKVLKCFYEALIS